MQTEAPCFAREKTNRQITVLIPLMSADCIPYHQSTSKVEEPKAEIRDEYVASYRIYW